jgi:membrane associated rhomboid family serine protease
VLKSVFVSMFLHAGLLHLLSNLWFLWIFGDNVEDRLGHFGFVVFYLACGVAAAAAHVVTHWGSGMPVVGASGAIRGVLGAYLISFPGARVQTLMPFLFMPLLVLIPAGLYLTLWFLGQFMTQAGNVAWQAHVGGFIAGVVLVMLMPDRRGFRVRWRGSPYSSERHHAS